MHLGDVTNHTYQPPNKGPNGLLIGGIAAVVGLLAGPYIADYLGSLKPETPVVQPPDTNTQYEFGVTTGAKK